MQKEKRKHGGICHRGRERMLSVLLSLAVVMTIIPVMPVKEVRAEAQTQTAAQTLEPTVDNDKVTAAKVLSFAGIQWYVIGCNREGVLPAEGSVTTSDDDSLAVLLAKENWGDNVAFDENASSAYGNSKLKTTIEAFVSGIESSAKNDNGTDFSGIIKTRTLQGSVKRIMKKSCPYTLG